MNCEIELLGERLILLPERAIWWPAQNALIIADLHWGKSAHFRKAGIAMPLETQVQDGNRLAKIIAETGCKKLIVAGDLFHSRHNKEVEQFGYWREAHSELEIDFIIGNHDILTDDIYQQLKLTIYKEGLAIGPFYISHDAVEHPELFVIHGHVHPGLSVPGIGGKTLPGFFVGKNCMVLPAFGQFTGFFRVKASNYMRIYLIGDGEVVKMK